MSRRSQRVLVTGASRGIGLAIFRQLLDDGFETIGTATSQESIPTDFQSFKWIIADFRSPDHVQKILLELENIGDLSGLVNNAGTNHIAPLKEIDFQHYDDLFGVNLKAPYFLSQKVSENMKPGGKIVNIASIWSIITKSGRTLYTTAKSGLAGMTRSMAVELAPKGILVNSVSPGFTMTELTDASLTDTEQKELCRQIPLGRMAQPNEIARLVSYLIGPDNTYLTGQNVIIDGGFSIV